MSKQSRTVEVTVCDYCSGDHAAFYHCIICGKDACFTCKPLNMVEYTDGVYFRGFREGCYCYTCNEQLKTSRSNALWLAYEQIQLLKKKARIQQDNLSIEIKKAETHLATIHDIVNPKQK